MSGRFEVWNHSAGSGEHRSHSKGFYNPPCFLREVVMVTPRSTPGFPKLEQMLCTPSDFSCVICATTAEEMDAPVLVDCCQSICCKSCITMQANLNSRTRSLSCPSCRGALGMHRFTNLRTPLGAQMDGSSTKFVAPSSVASTAALAPHPPQQQLAQLRVYECAGAVVSPGDCIETTAPSCTDGHVGRKPVTLRADGMHFCSNSCIEAALDRALLHTPKGVVLCTVEEARKHRLSSGWGGPLAGQDFSSKVRTLTMSCLALQTQVPFLSTSPEHFLSTFPFLKRSVLAACAVGAKEQSKDRRHGQAEHHLGGKPALPSQADHAQGADVSALWALPDP